MFSKAITFGLAALVATPASAYIRFSCANNVVEERADPIVFPGAVASHAHKIAGGNGFGFSMDYAQARSSKCSSCPIKQDLSNYWTPKLYFQNADGTFTSVPTVGDNAADLNGGMTVYYQQRGPAAKTNTLKAFPEGFRMLAGDSNKRSFSGDFAGAAINYACLGAGKPETNSLPNYNCPGGLRAQVYFPSCWDGVNLDSPDHKSHMSYPASGSHDNGPCPPSHPVQLISLFFEVLYDTNSFSSKWGNSKQPFVFANGDATGYGFHGDFVNGWDVPTLQNITDLCNNDAAFGTLEACPIIQQFTAAEQNGCKLAPQIDEKVAGTLPTLPGCNPVTTGPGDAPAKPICAGQAPATIGQAASYFTDVTVTKGWSYVGCGTDSGNPRTLGEKSSVYMSGVGDKMTVEWCMDFCAGYKYAGLEYASQCFCANTIPTSGAPQDGILGNCQMSCKGDAGEFCGGPNALSIYTKCTAGASCTNAGGAAGVHNSTSPTVPSVAAVVKLPTSSSSAAASSVVVAAKAATSSKVVAPKATNTPAYNPPSSIMYAPSSLSTLVKAASQPAPTVAKAVATPSSSSSVKTVYVTISKSPCSS